jgi:NADPH:quinone reductase-like Zn-dependent oxidoreductase
MIRWPAHAEVVNVPAKLVVRNPPTLGFEEAAAVWMQYLTAYGALIEIAKLRSKEFVIVTAASSSVGIAAIQIANRVGAIPIAVTRTSAKRRTLLEVGAAYVIALAEDDVEAGIRKITGSDGARVVFDPIGGPLVEPLTASMSRGGILIEYGALSLDATPFPLLTVLSKILTLRGYLVHEIVGDPERLDEAKVFILAGIASGSLRPVIARKFPLSEIVEAHRYLESNEQFGKVIVTV